MNIVYYQLCKKNVMSCHHCQVTLVSLIQHFSSVLTECQCCPCWQLSLASRTNECLLSLVRSEWGLPGCSFSPEVWVRHGVVAQPSAVRSSSSAAPTSRQTDNTATAVQHCKGLLLSRGETAAWLWRRALHVVASRSRHLSALLGFGPLRDDYVFLITYLTIYFSLTF